MRPFPDLCRKSSLVIVGLMSGTSHDGVDSAVVKILESGMDTRVRLLHHEHLDYPATLRARIKASFSGSPADICRLNFELGEFFGKAALACIGTAGLKISQVDAIASHGQTICHIPPDANRRGSTLQIGESAVIAKKTGLPVVSDFRTADMALNGHGAPLVPYADYILFRKKNRVTAAQNVGGIANVTVVTPELDEVTAFDTGPGNCLIDEAMHLLFRKPYDKNGAAAKAGSVDEGVLKDLLSHPYLAKRPPKSTGREVFGPDLIREILSRERMKAEDVIATLTHFTACSIKNAYDRFVLRDYRVSEIIVSGGGARNPFLMGLLTDSFKPIPVKGSEAYGIPSMAKEALSFAILANETLRGKPSNVPRVTGAKGRAVLGKIILP
ncbi:MAG TPA: anhydro-N-acetylmuramic acid kinase [Thermodesulfovibrionales bacterium]|nr:anhydro-N-acetylmuramic acid kinase [Thermodesulfovibrionales bacterium]